MGQNELTILDKIFHFITDIDSLIGVIIGALLAPIVNRLYFKKDRRPKLRGELIETLYLFYSVYKMHVRISNYIELHTSSIESIQTKYQNNPNKKLMDEFIYYDNAKSKAVEQSRDLYAQLSGIEGKLISICTEIEFIFNPSKYKSVKLIIDKIIMDSNNADNMTLIKTKQTPAQRKQMLPHLLHQSDKRLIKEGVDYIRDISAILKI